MKFICIAAPYYLGEKLAQRTEINELRASGIAESIGAEWVEIQPNFANAPSPLVAVNRALNETIAAYPEHFPVVFGSDCMFSLGMVKGLQSRHDRVGIVWYDAHGDFNTPETTPSGYVGGMPLAMLVGRGDLQYVAGVEVAPIDERDVVITDARDLDPGEREALADSQIKHLGRWSDLLNADLPDVPVYIHMDVDVIDSAEMLGLNYPVGGGPTIEQTAQTVERVARDGQVAGILFSLWDSSLLTDDNRQVPIGAAGRIVAALQAGLNE